MTMQDTNAIPAGDYQPTLPDDAALNEAWDWVLTEHDNTGSAL